MKSALRKNSGILLAIFAIALTAGLVSWGQHQTPGGRQTPQTDTVPKKQKSDREKKARDLDDVLDELNDAEIDVNMDQVREELREVMKNLDAEKIRLDIEKAMKEVDFDKIRKEVETSLANVDFKKIKAEIDEAMKAVDMEKIQREVEESMKKVDWEKMKADMERVKEVDMKKIEEEMKKVKEEMKDLGPRIEKEMAKAKEEIEKAKAEIKEYKVFVDGLEKDGLISKQEGYTLKHRDGELLINGKKASEQVYNKYRDFLEKHKKFSIEKTDDDFDMELD